MSESFDISLLIFAGLAVFVAWKLWTVLGQSPEEGGGPRLVTNWDKETKEESSSQEEPRESKVSPELRVRQWIMYIESKEDILPTLQGMLEYDPDFDAKLFLDGAIAAYEMIILAYARGDRATLRPLLSKNVFASFEAAIAGREEKNQSQETVLVSVDSLKLHTAKLEGSVANLTVQFHTTLITSVRDSAGNIVEGSPSIPALHKDLWTFVRDLRSADPNWILNATDGAHA